MGIVVTGEQLDLFTGEPDIPMWARAIAERADAWRKRPDRSRWLQLDAPRGVGAVAVRAVLQRALGEQYEIDAAFRIAVR